MSWMSFNRDWTRGLELEMENKTLEINKMTPYWPYAIPSAESLKPDETSFESNNPSKEWLGKNSSTSKKMCMGCLTAFIIIVMLGAVATVVLMALKPSRQRVTAVMTLRLNESYSSVYEDLDHPTTIMKMNQIMKAVDDTMKIKSQFQTTYVRSDVKSILNGSLVVILELIFESDTFLLKEEFRKSVSLELVRSALMNSTLNILYIIDSCWKSTSNDYTCQAATTSFNSAGFTNTATMTSDTSPKTSTGEAAQTTTLISTINSSVVSEKATMSANRESTNGPVTSSNSSFQTESQTNPKSVWDWTTDPTPLSGMMPTGKVNSKAHLHTSTTNSEYPLNTMLTATSFTETRSRTNTLNAVSSPTLESNTTTVTVNFVSAFSGAGATDKRIPGADVFNFTSDVSTQQLASLNSQTPMNESEFNDATMDLISNAMPLNATPNNDAIRITTEPSPEKEQKSYPSVTTQKAYTKITDPLSRTSTSTVYFFSTPNERAEKNDNVITMVPMDASTKLDSLNSNLTNTLIRKNSGFNTDFPITKSTAFETTVNVDERSNNVSEVSLINAINTGTSPEIPSTINDASTNIGKSDINIAATMHLQTSKTESETIKGTTSVDIRETATLEFPGKDILSPLVTSHTATNDKSTTTMIPATTKTINTNNMTGISILITTPNDTMINEATVDGVTATENITDFQTITENSISADILTTAEIKNDLEARKKRIYNSISMTTVKNIAPTNITDTISHRTNNDASTTMTLIKEVANTRVTSEDFATSITGGNKSFMSILLSEGNPLSTLTVVSEMNSKTLT